MFSRKNWPVSDLDALTRRPRGADAQVYCSRLARAHYENFTVASALLPRQLIRHFHAVYAYCRWADDLADESGGGAHALSLLRWWREELLQCYDGRPHHPVFVALQDTIRRFDIPPQPFLDLLSAFEQDQVVQRYDTFEQLLGYCRCSANPVGRLVLYLGESFDGERAALSDYICTALQLTNFWQDVERDFAIGRIYLPREDRARFGYSDNDLAACRFTPAFAELMRFEVERTRDYLFAVCRWRRACRRRYNRTSSYSCKAVWLSFARSRNKVTMCRRAGRRWRNGKKGCYLLERSGGSCSEE